MQEKIEILDVDLLKEHSDKLKLIDYWLGISGQPIGWHYWLDFIWILDCIDKMGLKKGAWIMDAGAGNGLLQFILAAKGFNIVSVDFAERDIPFYANKIFGVKKEICKPGNINHPYLEFICHKHKKIALNKENFRKLIHNPYRGLEVILDKIKAYVNPNMWSEALRYSRNDYGQVIYINCDFAKINGFKNESFDCIVSVSAIEHNEPVRIKEAIAGFERLLKKGTPMMVTTSAAKDKDWYFKACKGWCFSYSTLCEVFNISGCPNNFGRFDDLLQQLKDCELIKKMIPKIYFRSPDNGLPWGIYEPKYQPVGVIKIKPS